MKEIHIVKNNGSKEVFNFDKISEHIHFACEGLNGVSESEIAMNARLKIYDGCKSKDIQDALVKSAVELTSADEPDYDLVAGRLLNQKLRKEVYGQFTPKPFKDEVIARVKKGIYTKDILENYTEEELEFYGSKIKYNLDETLPHISVSQWYNKYLIKYKGKVIETPQEVFMLIPMVIFAKEQNRKDLILTGYKLLSQRKISLPTPIMNGVRTQYKKYISCNLINTGDSTVSLSQAVAKVMQCTAAKSGLGLNASSIRGIGADIGTPSRCKHMGILPLIKTVEAATASLSQVGRSGSVNINMPFYHYEIDLFCQLGDAKGTEQTRARHTDQTIILNKWFLKKALNKEEIFLFHTNIVPELFENLGNEKEFDRLYQKYAEKVPSKDKKKVNAFDLLSLFIFERAITGRVYFVFADNCYNTRVFKKTVYSTNLCCLAGDSMIETDRGLMPIKDVKKGDMVLSYNEETKQTEFKKCLNSIMTSPEREVLEIEYNGKKLVCTPDHRILTKRGYVEAQDLKENDELICKGTFYTKQEKLVLCKNPVKIPVYDIEVEDNHNFFANDICVHNCEILLPHTALDGSEGEPEIGACILGNMNLGYSELSDVPVVANWLVRFLDCLIDESTYDIKEVEYATKNRRALGIGISNLFGALAKNKIFYNTDEGREFLHTYAESFYYHLLKASNELAKEKGKCNLFDDTRYADGTLCFDEFISNSYNNYKLKCDWDTLRASIKEYGLRNSTLCATPPSANSGIISNATSSVEPPRELVAVKTDKNDTYKKLVPYYKNCKNYYTTAWGDDFNNKDYFKLISNLVKFTDQSISLNQYTNVLNDERKQVSINQILEELILCFNAGIKTLYYQNFLSVDNADGLSEKETGCSSGGCQV